MMTAIRKGLGSFVAIVALIVLASGVSYYILQEQRLRIPILEEKPFELKAEFETAQAVVAGQGQTIRVAGVRIGDVDEVELVDGRAVVTFVIDREFLPIYSDAKILMRPRTGLKDMEFHLDPGTRGQAEYAEGDTIPMANTAPDINLDEVLAALDTDNQAYLRTLIIGAGNGLEGRGRDLGRVLGSLGPINRDLERLNTEVAKRDENLKRLVTNLGELTGAVGRQDGDIVRLITASNDTLSAIGEQDLDVQRATALLPGALSQTRDSLAAVDDLGGELGPAFESLRPFARNLPELNESTRRLAETVTPVIADEIRPFVRAARGPIPDLNEAARRFSKTGPKLTTVARKLNNLGNMAAFNPGGAEPLQADGTPAPGRDEGYLYWVAWLGHNGVSPFTAQDGNGFYRRIYFTASAANIGNLLCGSPGGPVVGAIVTGLGELTPPGLDCDAGTGG